MGKAVIGIFATLVGILAVAVVYLGYLVIDGAITADHAMTQDRVDRENQALMVEMLNEIWVGEPKSDFDQFSEKFGDEKYLLKKTKHQVSIGELIFIFDEFNNVRSVILLNDLAADELE